MNKDLCNISEDFTREIRHVLIYDADQLSFNQNLRGDYPLPNEYLYKIDISSVSGYSRKIKLKAQNKNDYFDIDIEIPIFDLSPENRQRFYALNKDRSYVIVTASNKEMLEL